MTTSDREGSAAIGPEPGGGDHGPDHRPDHRHGAPPGPPSVYAEVQATDEFMALRRTLRRFIFPATIAFLAWYLLYVLMSGYARDFMGTKLLGNINVAYVFGLLQFLSTFLIAYLYSRWADKNFDPVADRIRNEVEARAHERAAGHGTDGGTR